MFKVSRVAFRLIFRSPVGPKFFSRGRANFLSQIDDAKVRNHGCGSRMQTEEKYGFRDFFFGEGAGQLVKVICQNRKSEPQKSSTIK